MVVGREGKPLLVRFPPGMREKLTEVAADSGRSRNSEIVSRLAESIGFDLKAGQSSPRRKKK